MHLIKYFMTVIEAKHIAAYVQITRKENSVWIYRYDILRTTFFKYCVVQILPAEPHPCFYTFLTIREKTLSKPAFTDVTPLITDYTSSDSVYVLPTYKVIMTKLRSVTFFIELHMWVGVCWEFLMQGGEKENKNSKTKKIVFQLGPGVSWVRPRFTSLCSNLFVPYFIHFSCFSSFVLVYFPFLLAVFVFSCFRLPTEERGLSGDQASPCSLLSWLLADWNLWN